MSPDVAVPAPEYAETADYFAKALELCWDAGSARDRSGTGVWITIQDAIPIMLRIGWNTIAKEKEKAVYSAVNAICPPVAAAFVMLVAEWLDEVLNTESPPCCWRWCSSAARRHLSRRSPRRRRSHRLLWKSRSRRHQRRRRRNRRPFGFHRSRSWYRSARPWTKGRTSLMRIG